jgi:antitoxin HicB
MSKTEIAETARELDRYMTLPYTIILRRDAEGDMVAEIKELEGCIAHGRDASEALEILKEFQQAWIERRIAAGQEVPAPEEEDRLPSGKWVQRVPRSLHKKLIQMAKTEGVSLNQLVTSMLSQQISTRAVQKSIDLMLAAHASQQRRYVHYWDTAMFPATHVWSNAGEPINIGIGLQHAGKLIPKTVEVNFKNAIPTYKDYLLPAER